jgi:DNA-directed RNA polymerase specialized sigma24 family protein
MLREKKKTVSVDFNDEETVNVLNLEHEDAPKVFDESGIIGIAKHVLNEKEFRIVILHAVNGVKFKEIARLTGGLESSVRWTYNNALKKIKNAYEGRNA